MRVQIGSVAVEIGRPERRGAPPSTLPRRSAAFTGREDELAEIGEQAAGEDPPRIIALCGRPGVGKTALAVEAAHRLRGMFPDGRLFVEARAHGGGERLDAADVLERLLAMLGHASPQMPPTLEQRMVLFHRLAEGRRLLIVVDDVVSAEELLQLRPPAGSLLLATGRRMLTAPGVLTFGLDGLRRTEAVGLLTAAGADSDSARAIALSCGFLPLALRIAAARLALDPDLEVVELARELEDRDDRIVALSEGMGDRAVRASFAASYRSLSPDERLFFRLLAALPLTDFSPASAAVLTGASEAHAERILKRLAALHLIDAHDGYSGVRYRFHDLVALFARELLDPVQGREAADRTALWYAERTGEAREAVDGPDPEPARHWYLDEWDNIVAAGRHLAARDLPEPMWTLVKAVISDADVHSLFGDWEMLHLLAIDLAFRHGQAQRELDLRLQLAMAYREGMRMDAAFAQIRESRRLTGLLPGPFAQAEIDQTEADLLRDDGDLHGALRLYRRSYLPEMGLTNIGWSLHGQADVLRALGRVEESLRLREAELAAFTEADYWFGITWAHHGFGETLFEAGDLAGAEEHLRTALRLLAESGAFKSEGWTLECLADVLVAAGRSDEALVLYERALRSYETRGNLGDQARALLRLGDQAEAGGRHEAARELWQAARHRLAGLSGGRVEQMSAELRARLADGETRSVPA
jgi:tetratricopeptide (TPR) repeat protein